MKNGILIVDDEQIIRNFLKKLLILDDYEVLLAENGMESLEILKKEYENINVVILDLKMPGLDGMEVLKEIKKMYHNIEVIITTGHGDVKTAVQTLRNGAFDYINKPIDYDELSLTIIRALERLENIRKRELAEKSLRLSEEKYRTLVESADDGIAIIQNIKFKYVNPRLCEMLGYDIHELINTNVVNYIKCKNINNFKQIFEKPIVRNREIVFYDNKGRQLFIELNAGRISFNDKPASLIIFRDITARKRNEQKIIHLSFHDNLTDLYNRAYFEQEIKRLDTARQLPLSIIIGDVNGLKLVNDAFGHIAGDNLLKKAGNIIKSNCRHEDIVARWGGDEFVILLPKTSSKRSEEIIARISNETREIKTENGIVSISFGYDTKEKIGEDILINFKEAENNMYRQKLLESPSVRSATIKTIISTLYEKNRREEKHAERVSSLSYKIGQAIGLYNRELNDVKTVGLLHDIGKVVILDDILEKKGELTNAEWKEIKRHPEIGYRILNNMNDMSELALSVLSHHERWDGKGYPKGIKGEEIPLTARIVAVADTFDAMTSDRPYRKALSEEVAIEEIKKNAGLQFNPYIARVFIEKVLGKKWD